MSSSKPPKKRRFNLPLALPLGGMILLGVTTTILGFVLWPEPMVHEDTSTEGWPDQGPSWLTAPTTPAPAPAPTPTRTPPAPAAVPAEPGEPGGADDDPDAGAPAPTRPPVE